MRELNEIELQEINGGFDQEAANAGYAVGQSIRRGLDICLTYAFFFM